MENTKIINSGDIEWRAFPDDFSERRSCVLNAVNHEPKLITLLHLCDRPVFSSEILSRMRESRGGGYLPGQSSVEGYGQTLFDVGMVCRAEDLNSRGNVVYKYGLSSAGRDFGIPVANLFLKWGVDNEISIHSVLGKTSSPGESRSPENRVEILKMLSQDSFSGAELTERLGFEQGVVHSHLKNLAKVGFVRYSSLGINSKGSSKYVWVGGKNPQDAVPVGKMVSRTKKVAEEVYGGGEFDCHTLAERLNDPHPKSISTVLSGLLEQGFLIRTNLFKPGESLSRASLLSFGERFLEEVVYPMESHLCGEENISLVFGDSFPDYVSRGMDISHSSPSNRQFSPEERLRQITDYLSENPGATSSDIGSFIGLSSRHTNKYLRELKEARGLKVEKEGTAVRYSLRVS